MAEMPPETLEETVERIVEEILSREGRGREFGRARARTFGAGSQASYPRIITPRCGVTTGGGVYFDGTYIVAAVRDSVAAGLAEIQSWEQYGYGTYEWYGLLTTPAANRNSVMGGFEEFGGQYKDSVYCGHDGANYYFYTYAAGANTTTILAGQNWTVERKFKIVWTVGQALLYVNDVLVATHVTNVPSKKLCKIVDVFHTAAQASHSYVKVRGLF